MDKNIIEDIRKMRDGDRYIVPESDYGKAEILFVNELYILFSIPLYGGRPMFEKMFAHSEFDKVIKTIDSWI